MREFTGSLSEVLLQYNGKYEYALSLGGKCRMVILRGVRNNPNSSLILHIYILEYL